MALSVDLARGRDAFVGSLDAFLAAANSLTEWELLAGSRCHGWTRLDVVVHQIAGWQDVLAGFVSQTEAAASVDAANFWTVFAQSCDPDPIPSLMGQRRRTAGYLRPSGAIAQLRDVGAAVRRGAIALPDTRLTWFTQVFTAGDFLTVWAVENAIHQLDLLGEAPPPDDALALTRATVEALLGEPLPATWSDADVALIGTGRARCPADAPQFADRLPVLR